jgi:hypothetical protein
MERSQYVTAISLSVSFSNYLLCAVLGLGRWAADPESSPIFDGSDTSMSGNGQKIEHAATSQGPAHNGGGCVQTGPFKK